MEGIDALVEDTKTDNKALFVECDKGLECVKSDFKAFVVGKVYTGIEILETDV